MTVFPGVCFSCYKRRDREDEHIKDVSSSGTRQQTFHKAARHFILPFATDVFSNVAAAVTGTVKVPDP